MTKPDRAHAARVQARVKAAERRFQRWESEMIEWGLSVVWPEHLTVPSRPTRPNYR